MASEKYIETQFYQAMGRFIVEWSSFEYTLALSFLSVLDIRGKDVDALYLAFCSGRNFNTKRDLFDAVAEKISDTPTREFARSVSKRASQYVTFRNKVAHDLVTKKIEKGLIWYEISPHRAGSRSDLNAVTLVKLKAATERIEALMSLTSWVFLFRGQPLEEAQQLIDKLPNEADYPLGVPVPPKKKPRVLVPRHREKPQY